MTMKSIIKILKLHIHTEGIVIFLDSVMQVVDSVEKWYKTRVNHQRNFRILTNINILFNFRRKSFFFLPFHWSLGLALASFPYCVAIISNASPHCMYLFYYDGQFGWVRQYFKYIGITFVNCIYIQSNRLPINSMRSYQVP